MKTGRYVYNRTVELLPEGPCGFEPLHLRQTPGFVEVAD